MRGARMGVQAWGCMHGEGCRHGGGVRAWEVQAWGGACIWLTSTSRRRKGRAAAPPPESHLSQLGPGLLQLVYMKQVITLHAGLTPAIKAGELLGDQSEDVENCSTPVGLQHTHLFLPSRCLYTSWKTVPSSLSSSSSY